MDGGVVSARVEGTPQGGPLSPLLLNILLDELDRELEQRSHRFVRYADDCSAYVRSKAAGERVMASLERSLARRLRLKVNREKSAVARPWERKFLGYSVTTHRQPKLKIAPQSVQRFKTELRALLRRGRGRSLIAVIEELRPILRGWVAYIKSTEVRVSLETLDQWLRRKAAGHLAEAVEEVADPASGTRAIGLGQRTCRGIGVQWTRPLVECRGRKAPAYPIWDLGICIVCLNPSRDRKGAGQLCSIASILCKRTIATSTGICSSGEMPLIGYMLVIVSEPPGQG